MNSPLKNGIRICAASLALAMVAVATPVSAGTLVTPPLARGDSANDYNCRVTNVGTGIAREVDMTIRDSAGNVDEHSYKHQITPGQSRGMLSYEDPATIAYCEVTGQGISKSKSRVTFCVRDWNNTPFECVTYP